LFSTKKREGGGQSRKKGDCSQGRKLEKTHKNQGTWFQITTTISYKKAHEVFRRKGGGGGTRGQLTFGGRVGPPPSEKGLELFKRCQKKKDLHPLN